MTFGIDQRSLAKLIAAVKRAVSNTVLITKLSPNVSSIPDFSRVAEDAGSDAISLINTPHCRLIPRHGNPGLPNVTGGLSGPAIQTNSCKNGMGGIAAVSIPVIGIAGITSTQDSIEFMLPRCFSHSGRYWQLSEIRKRPTEIINGLGAYLQRKIFRLPGHNRTHEWPEIQS